AMMKTAYIAQTSKKSSPGTASSKNCRFLMKRFRNLQTVTLLRISKRPTNNTVLRRLPISSSTDGIGTYAPVAGQESTPVVCSTAATNEVTIEKNRQTSNKWRQNYSRKIIAAATARPTTTINQKSRLSLVVSAPL